MQFDIETFALTAVTIASNFPKILGTVFAAVLCQTIIKSLGQHK